MSNLRSRNPEQVSPMSMDQFVQLSSRIDWNITNPEPEYIDIGNVYLDELPYRIAFMLPLTPPVHDLILYLPSTPNNEYPPDRMVYHSDRGFTPLEILGAIYTYYRRLPIPLDVLERMRRDGVANVNTALEDNNPRRIDLMGDLVNFSGLEPHRDGYQVNLID